MKASELRIGNLLKYTNSNKVKIELRDRETTVTADDILFLNEQEVDYVEPIQITAKWLAELGFKVVFSGEYGFITWKVKDAITTLHIDLIDFDARIYKKHNPSILLGKVNYVHQLQNLYFALTNNDLIVGKLRLKQN